MLFSLFCLSLTFLLTLSTTETGSQENYAYYTAQPWEELDANCKQQEDCYPNIDKIVQSNGMILMTGNSSMYSFVCIIKNKTFPV